MIELFQILKDDAVKARKYQKQNLNPVILIPKP